MEVAMSAVLYYILVIAGILVCGYLSVYILVEIFGANGEEAAGEGATYSIKTTPPPTPEIVAAITATISTIMKVPAYNFVMKNKGD